MSTFKERAILHCDMNNFYASVECMLNPSLNGKCVAVAGSVEDRNGIILAKNYEAKAFGVSTGEAIWEAQKKCKDLVLVSPNYDEYLKYSKLAREIYERYTDQIEPYGMDECWLDVTGSGCLGTPMEIAEEIREIIKTELGLTISIGLSFNKVFAKLGSDMKKPDAITRIRKDTFKEQIWHLQASEMIGVGRATEQKLKKVGIHTLGQLAAADESYLRYALGINGVKLKHFANGHDISVVQRVDYISPMKSIGHGKTTHTDLENPSEVWCVILHLTQEIGSKLLMHEKKATGVAVTIRNNKLESKTWQSKIEYPTQSSSVIARKTFDLFLKNYIWNNDIRSVSVRAYDLIEDNLPIQTDLFTDITNVEKQERLEKAVEKIRTKFGKGSIKSAVLFTDIKVEQNSGTGVIMPTGMIG